jgi:hypothetical protein
MWVYNRQYAAHEAWGHYHRFLSEVGLVRAEDQRLELFGTGAGATPLQGSDMAEKPLTAGASEEQDIKKKE